MGNGRLAGHTKAVRRKYANTAHTHLIDGAAVGRRRGELGYTAAYLGSLCKVSPSVIRHLESGWAQDDLPLAFADDLCTALGVTLADILHPTERSPRLESPATTDQPLGAQLGALLHASREPVPVEALHEVLGWDDATLDAAVADLHQALEHAGGVLVDNGETLAIAADVGPVDPGTVAAATRAAFGRRAATVTELRTLLDVMSGRHDRREAANTPRGSVFTRLRTIGVFDPPANTGKGIDPPVISERVRFSLMLDEVPLGDACKKATARQKRHKGRVQPEKG